MVIRASVTPSIVQKTLKMRHVAVQVSDYFYIHKLSFLCFVLSKKIKIYIEFTNCM